ncbi:Autophagy protein Apg9 [Novymonas esmeraldas]|uniref:Autophagy-related protein 9 n=1 Tax=Novymonas esmeraldas TaxID=1808958 RepID=A0AAW0F5E8_9TRYP
MAWQLRASMLRLPRFSLRFAGSGRIEDMRFFTQTLYTYWYHKGFWGATVASAVDFLNTVALLVVAVIFTMRFDWATALSCTEPECAAQSLVHGLHTPYIFRKGYWGHLWGLVFVCCTVASCAYELMRFVETYHLQFEVEEVARDAGVDTGFLTPLHRWRYHWRRGLDARDGHEFIGLRGGDTIALSSAGWGEFLETVCAAVGRNGSVKLGAPGEPLDPLRAVQSLMQLENYLIALHESDALQGTALQYVSPGVLRTLLDAMFDAFRTVESRHKCVWAVRSTLVTYAVLYTAGFLFVCVYATLKVLVKNAAQIKVNYWALSQRMWTTEAQWRFRLYNEVEHLHACRLRAGAEVATRMVDRLRVSSSLSRLVRRVCSTCVLVTAVLSFLNPALLIGGSIGGLTLVWWLTLALMVYACVPEVDAPEREYAYVADLERLVGSLHFSTAEWFHSADAFYEHITTTFFKNRLLVVVTGLLESLALPLLLLYALQDGSVERFVEFVIQHSVSVDGVGSIAIGSDWSAASLSGATAEDRESSGAHGASGSTRSQDAEMSATLLGAAASATGPAYKRAEKVRQSAASFAAVYSQWTLRHVDGPPGRDSPACERDAALQEFLRRLSDSVRGTSAAQRASAPAVGNLFVSRDSCASPTSARRFMAAREEAERNVSALDNDVSGVQAFSTGGITAHDREQLFVSQVSSSRFAFSAPRSAPPRPPRRDAADYGTE